MTRVRPLLVASLLIFAAPAGALELKPLLYSLIFPGAGEWSLGYKKRALAQFAVEAGCWSANVYYREQAYDKRHAYETYADAHWTEHDWLLPWDGIRPVYNPEFATAEEAPLDDEELIIGISLEGEAKAYPITVLRFREMVNDEMAGIPTLVTW